MKHTRRHFLLFALLFAACLTSSQAMAAELASDGNDAKTELNKAIKAVKRLGAFEARWEASEFQGSAQTASFSGNIYVSSPRVYLSTSQQSIWYDGHTEWNLRTGASEVYVSTPTAAEAAKINPLSFLSIPLSNYNAQPLKRTTLRGESTISIDLTARAGVRTAWKYIYITLDASSRLPLCVRFSPDGHRWTRISLYSLMGGRKFPTSLFQYPSNKYPNVDVVDLR